MKYVQALPLLVSVAQALPGYPAGHTPCSILTKQLPRNTPLTPYCQKYLHLPTSTYTSTTKVRPTTTVSCTTTVTTTTTETSTSVPTSTATDIETASTPSTVITVSAPITAVQTLTCFSQATIVAQLTSVLIPPVVDVLPKRNYPNQNDPKISSACKCLHVPRPSTTTTKTKTGKYPAVTVTSLTSTSTVTTTEVSTSTYVTTVTVTETPDTTTLSATLSFTSLVINPTGIHWAAHTAPKWTESNLPQGQHFQDPEYTKTDAPDREGTVNNMNTYAALANQQVDLYGSGNSEIRQYGIVYEGFFVAQTAGAYTFAGYDLAGNSAATRNDDEILGWSGAQSLDKTWTAASADFSFTYYQSPAGTEFTTPLQAREVLPVTYYWQDGTGQGRVGLFIKTPDGTIHSDTSGFFAPNCADS